MMPTVDTSHSCSLNLPMMISMLPGGLQGGDAVSPTMTADFGADMAALEASISAAAGTPGAVASVNSTPAVLPHSTCVFRPTISGPCHHAVYRVHVSPLRSKQAAVIMLYDHMLVTLPLRVRLKFWHVRRAEVAAAEHGLGPNEASAYWQALVEAANAKIATLTVYPRPGSDASGVC